MSTELIQEPKKNALQSIAERLQVDATQLIKTLKNTCFKVKDRDGKLREASDEEFLSLLIVANTYKLNPITKELYAFLDKNGGIVPIVSTDGWNNIMTKHPEYRTHTYRYSEKLTIMDKARPCPEWCEVDIEKKDGSHVVVREYLDEVFRSLPYANPWQTHTKRMLRHKTKIQGAREAFGFSGIYDEDEAHRVIELTGAETSRQAVEMPRAITVAAESSAASVASADESFQATKSTAEAPAAEAAQAEPFPVGYEPTEAKANGLCKGCQKEISVGTIYAFKRGSGGFHRDCVPAR